MGETGINRGNSRGMLETGNRRKKRNGGNRGGGATPSILVERYQLSCCL
jgi:hypothetical protein